MITNRKHFYWPFVLLFLLIVAGLSVASAQGEIRLRIMGVDTSEFPSIRLNVIAAGPQGERLPSLPGVRLTEDDEPIADYESREVPVGIELVFVIDANADFNRRDQAGGLSRREKVRDSIVRFADRFMNPSQLDRISVVVPDGDSGRLLLNRAVFGNAVVNEINFYEPDSLGETPLNQMMEMALDLAAQNHEEGRFQAILLFTDGATLDQQLDSGGLVARAQAIDLPIYAAILGARADPDEIANVSQLSDPTGASFLHMPEPEETDPLYEIFRRHGFQHQIEYRSRLGSGGEHRIGIEVGAVQTEVDIELEVEPPTVELQVDNSQPIRRVVDTAEAAISSAEPRVQPIVAGVTWTDDHPRRLTEVALLVDGNEQATAEAPVLDADGLLSFDWDISELDDGTYELAVRVTDELGLESVSPSLPMTIEIARPDEFVTTSSTELPATDEPEATQAENSDNASDLGILGVVFGGLALLGSAFLVVLAVIVVRRRRAAPAATTGTPSVQPSGQATHDATQVILPDFVARRTAGAYLEPLENAPEHQEAIPIASDNVALGRDPKLAQIVLGDKSVSRLHARIMETDGTYRLYDEGSASGTYINYERISLTPQPLSDNDEVHIGRVHLRFHVGMPQQDSDSTQVMAAAPKPEVARAAEVEREAEVDDGLSTQPYMPHQPQTPGRAEPAETDFDDDDADDVSTQPYMPHEPRR